MLDEKLLSAFIFCIIQATSKTDGTRGRGGGHSITKHTGGGGMARRSESKTPKYLSKNSNILKMLKSYPVNIPKVQSKGSKISNRGQNFIFTENCTPDYPYEPF